MYGELRNSFLEAQLKGDRRSALDLVIQVCGVRPRASCPGPRVT